METIDKVVRYINILIFTLGITLSAMKLDGRIEISWLTCVSPLIFLAAAPIICFIGWVARSVIDLVINKK